MYIFWLVTGTVTILLAIFNKQVLRLLGLKPTSEVITTPNLKRSSKLSEGIGRWLLVILGVFFILQGLDSIMVGKVSDMILLSLLVVAGLMFLAMVGITLANWKAR